MCAVLNSVSKARVKVKMTLTELSALYCCTVICALIDYWSFISMSFKNSSMVTVVNVQKQGQRPPNSLFSHQPVSLNHLN